MVAARLRRKRKITITTSATVSISSYSTSLTEARMVDGAVGQHLHLHRGRQAGLQLRQQLA